PPPESRMAQRAAEWSEMERLTFEKEALGFYLSGHPFEKRGRFFSRIAGTRSSQLADMEHQEDVRIAGMISGLREMVVKSGRNAGKKMARFQLEDLDGTVPVVVFTRTYEVIKHKLADDAIVVLRGRVDRQGEEVGLLCDEAAREVHSLVIRISEEQLTPRVLDQIADAATRSKGNQRLMFEVDDGQTLHRVRADARFSVTVDDALLDDLATLLGAENILFVRR
ncbi:MAG: OB-fold nucleic acid binding domain-containing protein, partial [Planctomycetota bacterium]